MNKLRIEFMLVNCRNESPTAAVKMNKEQREVEKQPQEETHTIYAFLLEETMKNKEPYQQVQTTHSRQQQI